MQTVTTIGLDIAKSVFQVHGVDAAGQVVIRRQLKRRTVPASLYEYTPQRPSSFFTFAPNRASAARMFRSPRTGGGRRTGIGEVRELVLGLPKEFQEMVTWRHVGAELLSASKSSDAAQATIALELVLIIKSRSTSLPWRRRMKALSLTFS